MTATAVAMPLADEPPPQPRWRPLPIRFTGSGSEYFRIWIVNLLLIVVTFSLYLPFAKARRLRYFHGNTLVGGHALGFHGQGSVMLRGYLLVLVFAVCYGLAGRFSPLAAGLAGLALALMWPALWQASLRFRLANTSWRGLRLRFTGSVAGAYASLLPVVVPVGLFLMLSGLRGHAATDPDGTTALVGPWADAVAALCVLALMGMAPWLFARMKRYQHGQYHLAGDTTTLQASGGDFYRLWLRGAGVSLLPVLVLSLVALLAVWLGSLAGIDLSRQARDPGAPLRQEVVLVLVLTAVYLSYLVVVPAWYSARLQNLVWSNTASQRLRFASQLRVRDLTPLMLKNLLLTVLTLGLYRPFAVVATTRLQL